MTDPKAIHGLGLFLNHLLGDLENIEITAPADGEVLTYESATALWKNKPPAPAVNVYTVLGTTDVTTTSTTFVPMPDMTLTATFGAKTVLVLFIAPLRISKGTGTYPLGRIRLLIDGVEKTRSRMGLVYGVSHVDIPMNLHWIEDLTAGSHTFQIEWRVEYAGNTCRSFAAAILCHRRLTVVEFL